MSRHVNVVPSFYKGRGKPGDFERDIRDPTNATSLYLYCENVWATRPADCVLPGAGSAAVRPFSHLLETNIKDGSIQSCGVATGWSVGGGFEANTNMVRSIIRLNLQQCMITIRDQKNIDTVVFPASRRADGKIVLGSAIFDVPDDLVDFITEEIMAISEVDFAQFDPSVTHAQIRKKENKFMDIAQMHYEKYCVEKKLQTILAQHKRGKDRADAADFDIGCIRVIPQMVVFNSQTGLKHWVLVTEENKKIAEAQQKQLAPRAKRPMTQMTLI